MHSWIVRASAAPLPWFPASARLGCFKEPLLEHTPSPWYLAISQRRTTKRSLLRSIRCSVDSGRPTDLNASTRDALRLACITRFFALRGHSDTPKRAVGRSHESNSVCPYEAIAQRTHASAHARTARLYREWGPNPEWPLHWERRGAFRKGSPKFQARQPNLSETLAMEPAAVVEGEEQLRQTYVPQLRRSGAGGHAREAPRRRLGRPPR